MKVDSKAPENTDTKVRQNSMQIKAKSIESLATKKQKAAAAKLNDLEARMSHRSSSDPNGLDRFPGGFMIARIHESPAT